MSEQRVDNPNMDVPAMSPGRIRMQCTPLPRRQGKNFQRVGLSGARGGISPPLVCSKASWGDDLSPESLFSWDAQGTQRHRSRRTKSLRNLFAIHRPCPQCRHGDTCRKKSTYSAITANALGNPNFEDCSKKLVQLETIELCVGKPCARTNLGVKLERCARHE